MTLIISTLKNWWKWRKDWEELCNGCGKCCYRRTVEEDGTLTIHYTSPCEYLDEESMLCTVYAQRFEICDHCGKVTLWTALFNKSLPEDCPYVTVFRTKK